MNDSQTVLLIEDNPGDARLIEEMLLEHPGAPFRLACVDSVSRALQVLSREQTKLVLLDLSMPDSQGLDTFAKVYAHSPKIPLIVLTGNDDNAVALAAVKSGAQDYLIKGKFDGELLVRAIRYSIERKGYQEALEHQANYDALSGLPNRNLLRDRLKQALRSQRNVQTIAVVFIDLDHFKFVNDSLGHDTGDKLLRSVAERLQSTLRDGDTVARLGGDEFVLVLAGQITEEGILRALQRIIAKVGEPVTIDNRELNVTCSAGVSLYPQDGRDVDTLLKNADTAMYRVKEHGRNNFQFFTPEMNELVCERLALEHALRRALERNEMRLHYQPKVDIKTGAIIGAEALLRWRHPVLGMISPTRFIPVAEETGLIVSIGEWVLRTACIQTRAWRDASLPSIVMSVNLSARQFRQKRLAETVERILSEARLDAEHLEMELTESMVMHDAEIAIEALQALKSIGARLSVDDFGTGHSSLSYLNRLPIDTLKIDQSFVRSILVGDSANNGVLAKAIISLGHSLHLTVIAEGVETDTQLKFLRTHQCDEVQGFYFSKAVPPEDFTLLLQQPRFHTGVVAPTSGELPRLSA